jgi:MFS transporter, DHA1 family, multidrug resistance protein
MNFSAFARNATILGLLTAVGPFAIDMYLPALPTIAADLHAPTAATQMTLTAFLAAFGVCQIVYGPVSDMVGRKPPLFFGLAIFLAGSIGCASAASIRWLIAFRALQGIGASAAMVIPRAIVRDLHTGRNATRLMALVMLVFSVSPILAPLVGSGLIAPFGWRGVFVGVACVAVIAIFLVAILLPETRPPGKRVRVSLGSVLGGFGQLLRNGRFVGLTLIGAFGMASFLAFLANSSFIYIDHFGLTPTQYSFAFAVNAISFFGSSQFAATLGARLGMSRVVLAAIALNAFFDLILFALTAASFDSLPLLMALLFCAFACLGLVIPSTMVLALEEHGPIAGMASALSGVARMLAGAIAIAIVSLFFDGTTRPMVAAITLCAIGSLTAALATLGRLEFSTRAAE